MSLAITIRQVSTTAITLHLVGEVANKECILIDDIIDTGQFVQVTLVVLRSMRVGTHTRNLFYRRRHHRHRSVVQVSLSYCVQLGRGCKRGVHCKRQHHQLRSALTVVCMWCALSSVGRRGSANREYGTTEECAWFLFL